MNPKLEISIKRDGKWVRETHEMIHMGTVSMVLVPSQEVVNTEDVELIRVFMPKSKGIGRKRVYGRREGFP